MARRIEKTQPAYPWLVCEHEGSVAGYAYATRHRERAAYRWSVETSVYIRADYRGTGIGRGLYTSLLGILAAQGYRGAFAGIALPNDASVRLHEAVGFRPIGVFPRIGHKLGAWHDVGWWYCPLDASDSPPAEIRSVAEVYAGPKWNSIVEAGLYCIGSKTRHGSQPH